jgi:hypothetical protein
MCDALSINVPELPAGVEILLANCLALYLNSGIIQRTGRIVCEARDNFFVSFLNSILKPHTSKIS